MSLRLLVASDLFSYLVFAVGGRVMHSPGGPGDWFVNTPRIIAPFLVAGLRPLLFSGPTRGRAELGCVDLR